VASPEFNGSLTPVRLVKGIDKSFVKCLSTGQLTAEREAQVHADAELLFCHGTVFDGHRFLPSGSAVRVRSGRIVGVYLTGNGVQHGFEFTPAA